MKRFVVSLVESFMNCSACGSAALVSGTVLENSGGGTIAFKIDDVSVWKSMFGIGSRKVRAYGCVHCGHLQLAVEFTEKDRKRYQQFEGQQPGVLERINSETPTDER
jgi:transcription elongation factor Elf1